MGLANGVPVILWAWEEFERGLMDRERVGEIGEIFWRGM